jgi:cytochrome P450
MPTASSKPPPGPRLPAGIQSVLFFRRPLEYVSWVRRRYGPVARLKDVMLGEMAYVSDPKLVGQIFKGDPQQMHAGEANDLLGPVVGPNSVLLLDDGQHMRMRKLLMPPFHGESIRRYEDLIEQVTKREIERWPLGRPFPIRSSTQAITLDVILRAVFGIEEPRRLEELRRILPALFDISLLMAFRPLRIDLGRWSPWGRFLRARQRVDEILYEEIERRRKHAGDETGFEIISLLLAARDEDGEPLSDEELRDELVTMLLAGHETTATALAWAFERLLRHPEELDRLRREIEAGEDAYLDAVCKETLRVRPVVMDVGRRLTRPFELGGYTIEAGTAVMPAIAAIHFSPDVYEDPEAFRPERFLERQPEPNAWIPFGGGVRRCIGAAFAQFEMKVVLRTILQRAELRAPESEPEKVRFRGITLVPQKGGVVVLVRRLDPGRRVEQEPSLAGAAAR